MNCKNCIHNDLCKTRTDIYYPNQLAIGTCDKFKNKDLFVELPCKMGEQLYLIRTRVDSDKKFIGKATTLTTMNLGYVLQNYGKTMFTEKEIEQKLKETKGS